MEAGVFGQDGHLNKLHVGMALGEGPNAGHDGAAGLAPGRIPQNRQHFVVLGRLIQSLLVGLEVPNIRNQLSIRFGLRCRRLVTFQLKPHALFKGRWRGSLVVNVGGCWIRIKVSVRRISSMIQKGACGLGGRYLQWTRLQRER